MPHFFFIFFFFKSFYLKQVASVMKVWLYVSPYSKMRAGFRNYVLSFLVKLRPKPCASLQLYQVYRHFCDIFIDMNTKRERKLIITKTCLYNLDPIKPHFYIVKLGFTGVYIFFLFLLKNIHCGYALEPPRRGGSNEYP